MTGADHDVLAGPPSVGHDETLDGLLWRWGCSWPWVADDGRALPAGATDAGIAVAEVLGDGCDLLTVADIRRDGADGFAVDAWVVSRELACRVGGDGAGEARCGPVRSLASLIGAQLSAAGLARPDGDPARVPAGIARALARAGTRPLGVGELDLPEEIAGDVIELLADEGVIAVAGGRVVPGPEIEWFPALAALASGEALVVGRQSRTLGGMRAPGRLRLVGPRDARWMWVDHDEDDDVMIVPQPAVGAGIDPLAITLLDLATTQFGPSWVRAAEDDGEVVMPELERPDVLLHVVCDEAQGRSSFGVAMTGQAAHAWTFDGFETAAAPIGVGEAARWLASMMLDEAAPVASAPEVVDPSVLGALVAAVGARRCERRCVLRGSCLAGGVASILHLTVLVTDAGAVSFDGLPWPGPQVTCRPATSEGLAAQLDELLAVAAA